MSSKHFLHSKTLWFNLISLVLLVLTSTELAQVFPDGAKYIALLTLIGNGVLRLFFTDTALTGHRNV